jgi:hypothetical protein
MNKLGINHKDYIEVKQVLRLFQAGYTERDIEKVDNFMKELFITGERTCALGTGTGELFLGSEQVKILIRDDWEYWGDVIIDWDDSHISIEGEVAWFAASGSVKYTFEDTAERYDSYVSFIKKKLKETELTPKQRITFINWVLALTYHQRDDKKREYLWPLQLSGVLLKEADRWKFVHLQFSIPKPNFPDERFENSKEHMENYNKQNDMVDVYKNNEMTEDLRALLKSFETELFAQKDISENLVRKYFGADSNPHIIGPENQWYNGVEQVRGFFAQYNDSSLTIDLNHAIASKSGEISWVTATGILKQELTEDELAKRALTELDNLFIRELTSKEKLFAAHRSIAYALKESALGINFTFPIRLTAVILNQSSGPVFQHIHFSFPSYWIFEEKIDSVI